MKPSLNYEQELSRIRNKVALHIRLGDYLLHPQVYSIPSESYYLNALEITAAKEYGYSLFLENLPEAEKRFPRIIRGASHVFTSKDFDSVETLCLMSNARNLITANSSFSSWAGIYVGKRKGIVVSPDRIPNQDLMDYRPENWIRLKLTE